MLYIKLHLKASMRDHFDLSFGNGNVIHGSSIPFLPRLNLKVVMGNVVKCEGHWGAHNMALGGPEVTLFNHAVMTYGRRW